jgi:hypothetical protein
MSAHSRRKQPRTKVTFRQEADKPVTLQLTRIPPEEAAAADALPLKILFKIEIEPDNPKRERVWNAFGAFLAEVLTPAESRELLRQWEEQLRANECATEKGSF